MNVEVIFLVCSLEFWNVMGNYEINCYSGGGWLILECKIWILRTGLFYNLRKLSTSSTVSDSIQICKIFCRQMPLENSGLTLLLWSINNYCKIVILTFKLYLLPQWAGYVSNCQSFACHWTKVLFWSDSFESTCKVATTHNLTTILTLLVVIFSIKCYQYVLSCKYKT